MGCLTGLRTYAAARRSGRGDEWEGRRQGQATEEAKVCIKGPDDSDLEFQKKKKEEAAALKALKEKAAGKGGFAKVKGSK